MHRRKRPKWLFVVYLALTFFWTSFATSQPVEMKLEPVDIEANQFFGTTVGIDGDFAIVGSPHALSGGVGHAFIYQRIDDIWIEEAALQPEVNPNELNDLITQHHDSFGHAVAISGERVIIGEPSIRPLAKDVLLIGDGAAHIYKREGEGWVLEARLTIPNTQEIEAEKFGFSVDIDGDYAIVGAPGGTGAAYVFMFDGAAWVQKAELTGDDLPGSEFGQSVAISGPTAIVSEPPPDPLPVGMPPEEMRPAIAVVGDPATFAFENQGCAYVYQPTPTGVWERQSKLLPQVVFESSDIPVAFGTDVDVDHGLVVVSAPGYTFVGEAVEPSIGEGGAFVFGEPAWEQLAALRVKGTLESATTDIPDSVIGASVAISEGFVAVGATFVSTPTGAIGAAYLFQTDGTGVRKLFASDMSPPLNETDFGRDIAISGDCLIVGSGVGAAHTFCHVRAPDPMPPTEPPPPEPPPTPSSTAFEGQWEGTWQSIGAEEIPDETSGGTGTFVLIISEATQASDEVLISLRGTLTMTGPGNRNLSELPIEGSASLSLSSFSISPDPLRAPAEAPGCNIQLTGTVSSEDGGISAAQIDGVLVIDSRCESVDGEFALFTLRRQP